MVADLRPVPWRREDREWLEDRVRLIMTGINTGAFLTILVAFLISAHDGTPSKAWTAALATSSTSEAVVMRYYFSNKNPRS
jgi:ABC-type enterobactin transport system permease subunit